MNGNDLRVPNMYMPSVPHVPSVPSLQMPRVPSVPRIGNLGSFNNAVTDFINTNNTEFTNPFDDPNRYRSLADVVFSRKLIQRDSKLLDTLEDAGDWVSDNVIRNIPLIGPLLETVIDTGVSLAQSGWDAIKEVPYLGDVAGVLEDYTIREIVGLPERFAGYVNNVYIEPWQWGGPGMMLMSVLNAVGKDVDFFTGANAIKSIIIPLAYYVFTGGEQGNLDVFNNLAKSIGLDPDAGLTHYEWQTGILAMKDIPIIGEITTLLADATKDIPVLGTITNMLNEMSLVDFGLEIFSSPDTYISFGLSSSIRRLLKNIANEGSTLYKLTNIILKDADDISDISKVKGLRMAQKDLIKNIKGADMSIEDAFTKYYLERVLTKLEANGDDFIKQVGKNSTLGKLLTKLKNADSLSLTESTFDELKDYLYKEVKSTFSQEVFETTAEGVSRKIKTPIAHQFEIVEKWQKANKVMNNLQSLASYNIPVYNLIKLNKDTGNVIGSQLSAMYNNIMSYINRLRVEKMDSIPKDSFIYDDHLILNKVSKQKLDKQIEVNFKSYIDALPGKLKNIDAKTFRQYYDEAVEEVLNSRDYVRFIIKNNEEVHKRAVSILIKRLEDVYGTKIPTNVKLLLSEAQPKQLKNILKNATPREKTLYKSIQELTTHLREVNAANNSIKNMNALAVKQYFGDVTKELSNMKSNYTRIKFLKDRLFDTRGETWKLSEYQHYFRRSTPDISDVAIKEFEKLLNNMGLNTKELRTLDAILDIDKDNLKTIATAFRKSKTSDEKLLQVLLDHVQFRRDILANASSLDIYKKIFKERPLQTLGDIETYKSLKQRAKDLFGEQVKQKIDLNLNQRLEDSLQAYNIQTNKITEGLHNIHKTGGGKVVGTIDSNARLSGRKIVAGDLARQQTTAENFAKAFKAFFNYDDYIEYLPYKDQFFYEGYEQFTNEFLKNLSNSFKDLEDYIPDISIVREDIIPLYKGILEKINPTELTKAPTEQQVLEWVQDYILKKYSPDELIQIQDDLQMVKPYVKRLIQDLDAVNEIGKRPNIVKEQSILLYEKQGNDVLLKGMKKELADRTTVSLRQFDDFINTLTREDVANEMITLAEVMDKVYKLKMANRMNVAYVAEQITNEPELFNSLIDIVEPTSNMHQILETLKELCKNSSDEAMQQIGGTIEELIDRTQGFLNYYEFFVNMDNALKRSNVKELANVVYNELQNMVVSGDYTSKLARKLMDNDGVSEEVLDNMLDQLTDRVLMTVGSHKFINNLSEESREKLTQLAKDNIVRDLKELGVKDIDLHIDVPKGVSPERYTFRLDLLNATPKDLEETAAYLEKRYRFSRNNIKANYMEASLGEDVVSTFTIDGTFLGAVDDHGTKGIIDYTETAIPFMLEDILDDARTYLSSYIEKQAESPRLPLFYYYDGTNITDTKIIRDGMEDIMEMIQHESEFSPEVLGGYMYAFLNTFSGTAENANAFKNILKDTWDDLDAGKDIPGLNQILTETYNNINSINKYYEQYGIFAPEELEVTPFASTATLDLVLKEVKPIDTTTSAVFNENTLKNVNQNLTEPAIVYRIQQKYNNNKVRYQKFPQAPENILANQAYFDMCAVYNTNIKALLKNVSAEELREFKWMLQSTPELGSLLKTWDQNTRSFREQVLEYYELYAKKYTKEVANVDTNYLRNRLSWMSRDVSFAAEVMFPAVQEELIAILGTNTFNKELIEALVLKLGGTLEEADVLFKKLNNTGLTKNISMMKYDVVSYCLSTVDDPATLMAWYTTVVQNQSLYKTLKHYDKTQKTIGNAASSYIPNVSSEVLKNKRTKELIQNGASTPALELAKEDMTRGGVFKKHFDKIPDSEKTIEQRVQDSKTIAACITSGQTGFDTLGKISKELNKLKGDKQTKQLYVMEQLINDMQIQTLYSLNTKELGEFIRDNYGLIYINTQSPRIPWSKTQLKKAGLDIVRDGDEVVIYNTLKNYKYGNSIGTKQFADIKIQQQTYRNILDKINPLKDELFTYTNISRTPFGNDLFIPRTITHDDIANILENFQIQNAYLNGNFFNVQYSRIDNVRFISSYYRGKAQKYSLNYEITLSNNYYDLIKNADNKTKYIDQIFRQEVFDPKLYEPAIKDLTDQEVAQFFKENKLTGVAITTTTKGGVVYPKAVPIRIRTQKDFQLLLDHPDITAIVPEIMRVNMVQAINYHGANSALIDVLQTLRTTWKMGIVSNLGQIIRNKWDTLVKNSNETGNSMYEELKQQKVAGVLHDMYNEIYEKAYELYGDISYKKLDSVLDAMLESTEYNLTTEDKLLIKRWMRVINTLDTFGTLDSEVEVLKKLQDTYNKKYLTGYKRVSAEYLDLIQRVPGIKQLLKSNSNIEFNARLSLAMSEFGAHKSLEQVIEKIDKVHFNYADKSAALQKAELFIPFTVFPTKNLAYWFNGGLKMNSLYRAMYIFMRQSWSDEKGTFGRVFYRDKNGNMVIDPYAVQAISNGSIRLGDHILKLGNSFYDSLNLVMNPFGEAQSRLDPLMQYALSGGTDTYSLVTSVPFVGRTLYRLMKGQSLTNIIAGNIATTDYTKSAYQKRYNGKGYSKGLYYKYPKSNRNKVRYGKYPKVSYKAMHSSNRSVAFKRYYGKVSYHNIYYDLYKKNKYAIVNLRKWQAQNPSYYWSNARNIVSNARRIRSVFR